MSFSSDIGALSDLNTCPANVRLAQVNALDWLQSLSDESVDLIVTDPPYESLLILEAMSSNMAAWHGKSSCSRPDSEINDGSSSVKIPIRYSDSSCTSTTGPPL